MTFGIHALAQSAFSAFFVADVVLISFDGGPDENRWGGVILRFLRRFRRRHRGPIKARPFCLRCPGMTGTWRPPAISH